MPATLERLDSLAAGYQQAQVLFTAVRLRLFTTLGERSLTLADLVRELRTDRRGLRILCDALVGMEVLFKDDDRYRNGEEALTFLVPSSPHSRVDRFLHGARQYARWGGLFDAVREGQPSSQDGLDPRLSGDETAFARAMRDVAKSSAATTFDHLEISGIRSFLDVGGGPGAYAIEAARRNEELTAAVFDTPGTLEYTTENVKEAGLSDRVRLLPGDAFRDDLEGPWDLVLLSNILHVYSAEEGRTLVRRCAEALSPGGRLAVKDFLLESDRTHPPAAALFSVNMLVSTERGDCYCAEEVEEWMRAAGLEPGPVIEITGMSRLLIGTRAG